ncbi:zinc ribbon domain-containing protein [Ruegeria sp. 2205SS24-7]|uniref:zinc ribbon domain-containing protein n=1 Tax=Ruegeria discodermiae TaxID=3064389 RepID=UPI0027425F85|nr:zinc ribbon domain-containing protein [Ruegeria sp. 2205SS24-7]MDP5220269.1 zinc ribbon domain-containing protein [Ruegeria sp. 2205SS24-7]
MSGRCQSCGMPLSKDPEGGGSEADGSRSSTYCSICYAGGAFRHPDASLSEFQAHCVDALAAKGMPRILAWAFTRGMGKLDRWREA